MIFHELLVRPLYNILILIVDVLPDGYLALAIIVLTILIRLALLGPAGAAIRSQREMQRVTPEIEKIKKKYAGNQQKIAEETMALFKKHKVNPLGGCLPILIQLPILWAFFWVLKSVGAGSEPLLYSFVPDPTLNTGFLWIPDITKPDAIWMPILVALFQFAQMKSIIWHAEKKRKKMEGGDIAGQQKAAQKMMTYFMPIMIGFIARGLSAGLALYWITTSIFSVVQQLVIAARDEKGCGLKKC